jgi:hypothetical protein
MSTSKRGLSLGSRFIAYHLRPWNVRDDNRDGWLSNPLPTSLPSLLAVKQVYCTGFVHIFNVLGGYTLTKSRQCV